MKTDKHNMDLEGVLAEVEHAGRDARRQQELGEIIDRMAATPQSLRDGSPASGEQHRRHGAWWWTSRVAAAACILFFISTAVRIWFIPTGGGETLTAENVIPDNVNVVLMDTAASPVAPTEPMLVRPTVRRQRPVAAPVEDLIAEAMPQPVEEAQPVPEAEDYIAEAVDDTVPELIQEYAEMPETAPLDETLQPARVAQVPETTPSESKSEPKARKRSFLSSLFRLAEPSEMDGVTLALLEF